MSTISTPPPGAPHAPGQTAPHLLQPEKRVLSTLNTDGSRRWIRPRLAPGRFLSARRAVGYALIAVFVSLPWLKINDKPVILLDILRREFTLFGRTFLPTDSLMLALLMVSLFVAVFFVTALLGRVWCGWGCPQTVYMEFVFRPIERLLTGAPGHPPRRIPAARAIKFAVYLVLCFALANTFLAYFVGADSLVQWVQRSPIEHPLPFLVMAFVTALMMFDFAFFREQLCLIACPYGRFQSVMLDRDSLIVIYDRLRGEPRGKAGRAKAACVPASAPAPATPAGLVAADSAGGLQLCLPTLDQPAVPSAGGCKGNGACSGNCRSKAIAQPPAAISATPATPPAKGDCIDCTMCTQVCPTGIDIRNGLQNECIGCAACIDVCDDVMDKMGYAKGLIRYSTENGVVNGWTRLQMFKRALRPRVLVYGAVLSAASIAFAASVAMRSPFKFDVVKDRGALARVVEDGTVENVYRIQIMNRTEAPQTYRVAASGIDGLEVVATPASAGPAAVASMSVSLRLPFAVAQGLAGRSVPVVFEVKGVEPNAGSGADTSAIQFEKSTFFIPR